MICHDNPEAVCAAAEVTTPPQNPTPDQAYILRLPWDIRCIIIADVTRGAPERPPNLTPEFIKDRARVMNSFDEDTPAETNIFLPKGGCARTHGNGLLGTNRQLRQDTLDFIHNMREREASDVPYALDLMLVHNVGIFPTWVSYPFRPKRMARLQINIRTVRPEKGLVPREWIFRCDQMDSRQWHSRAVWNLIVIYLFYTTGQLTLSPIFKRQGTGKAGENRSGSRDIESFEARLLPRPRSAIDEITSRWPRWDISADGEVITPTVEQHRVGHDEAFCREAGVPYLPRMSGAGNGHSRRMNAGRWLPYRMTRMFRDQLTHIASYERFHIANDYNATLLDHVGRILRPADGPGSLPRSSPLSDSSSPVWRLMAQDWFPDSDDEVAAALAAAAAAEERDERVIRGLRHVLRRMSMGWWDKEQSQYFRQHGDMPSTVLHPGVHEYSELDPGFYDIRGARSDEDVSFDLFTD
ncbi:hypothetical protein NLG97_g10342 [Lecanicillium saksenae]|uniref:Uncharacterized protein n=1 Tax=Lecanicillium saksenae TaxID=468837 RepID=A0ACC1QFB2_9HYPO|nr:hypothetical protein NLG97_g10342 [Lecanicillium saksenae]